MKTLEPRYIQEIKSQFQGNEKIEYLKSNPNLVDFLIKMEFNGSHYSQIVVGKEWEEKIKYIQTKYNSSKYSPKEVQMIMNKKDWKKRLNYELNT